MLEKIQSILNDSFPLEEDRRTRVIIDLIISALVVVAMVIFKPFGLENMPYQMAKQLPVYLGFGAVTFAMFLMTDYIIKPAFPVFFDEQYWTVKKNMVWGVFVVLLVAVSLLFYGNAVGLTGISGSSLLHYQLYTVAYSMIPVAIITLVIRFGMLHRNIKTAAIINEKIKVLSEINPSDDVLLFTAENEIFKLLQNQFLFAESAANYTDIVYLENGIVKRYLLPATLQSLKEEIQSKNVIRVHRRYIVNITKILSVKGTAQGLRLQFNDVEQSVPVSKRSSPEALSLFRQLSSTIKHKK